MFSTCSMDFFTVPTATFKILFVFFIIHNERRKIIHFNVTSNPTAQWTGQQIAEAFPWDTTTKYITVHGTLKLEIWPSCFCTVLPNF